MALRNASTVALLCALAFALEGCQFFRPKADRDDHRSGASDAEDDGDAKKAQQAQAWAPTTEVRMKRVEVLQNDLVQALGLKAEELCHEAGDLSCLTQVHNVALGGVSAYDLGIFTPMSEASTASVIAWERVAQNACGHFAERATAGQDADRMISDLFHKILARDPSAGERQELTALHAEIGAENFLHAGCYVLTTSVEFTFY